MGSANEVVITLQWRHNDHDGVSNHQSHGSLLNRLFRRRSKKTSKLRVTGLCVGNSPGLVNSPYKGPVTRKIWWRLHEDWYHWLKWIRSNTCTHQQRAWTRSNREYKVLGKWKVITNHMYIVHISNQILVEKQLFRVLHILRLDT